MEAMRESWTDERLDDLNGKVDSLRLEMKSEFGGVRSEMNERFDKVDERFDRSDERLERMGERFDQRLDSLSHVLILFSGGVCAALVTALAGLVATQL